MRIDYRIIVEKKNIVGAMLQSMAYPDIVPFGKTEIFIVFDQNRTRKLCFYFRAGIILGTVINNNYLEIRIINSIHRFQAF